MNSLSLATLRSSRGLSRPGLAAQWLLLPVAVACTVMASSAARSAAPHAREQRGASAPLSVSILVYHRFGPAVADAMTVRTSTLRWQLRYLEEHGHKVVPLRAVVAQLRGLGPPVPPGSVAITVDDGHRSIFTEMLPVVRERGIPVTLFLYPSAISNASYALTWEQLAALQGTRLFDVQSHSYWHPNFKVEKRRLAPAAYADFVRTQLTRSRTAIERRLGGPVDLIAWPFGIYDDELMGIAEREGFVAGFTIDRRIVTSSEATLALPRFLVTDTAQGAAFAAMLREPVR